MENIKDLLKKIEEELLATGFGRYRDGKPQCG